MSATVIMKPLMQKHLPQRLMQKKPQRRQPLPQQKLLSLKKAKRRKPLPLKKLLPLLPLTMTALFSTPSVTA